MDRPYDAHEVLGGAWSVSRPDLTGRANTVLRIEGDEVRVGTSRASPNGTLVPIRWVHGTLGRLSSQGEVQISVESVGYRSAFIGAVLSALVREFAGHDARDAGRPLADAAQRRT